MIKMTIKIEMDWFDLSVVKAEMQRAGMRLYPFTWSGSHGVVFVEGEVA